MPERQRRLRDSVFAKLVATMLTMAVSLILLVSLFFIFVVARSFHDQINRGTLHNGLLVLLLVVIVAVVLATYVFLEQLLRPLRVLTDGVARLGDGDLDVKLPHTASDEFGRVTEAFNHMVERVRDMIGAREQLLIDVSHELRSPLTRMKVTLELPPDEAQRARLAEDIAEMESMVTTLLELERLRMRRGISAAREDLVAMLHEVAARFQDRPPGVRVVPTARAVIVEVDGEKIRTVLRNLVENAVKYSLPRSRPVELSAVMNADTVVVRVTDDGAGIPDGDVARIFEPFFRADRSRSKTTGGYGLGLSICKRVMEAHGGSIRVERPAGGGASFILTFPNPAIQGTEHPGRCPALP